MVSGFVVSVQGKEIEGKIVVVKVRNSQRMNDPLLDHCRKCPSQPSSGKIFWKLLTVKQQTGIQDLTTLHLVRGAGGYSQKNLVWVCGPLPKTLTLFMTKICDFPYDLTYDLTKNLIPYL